MPRKRRPVRPIRRPNFQRAMPAPPSEGEEGFDEAPPTFADDVAIPDGFNSGGPVETRPHRIARDERAQGRRMAQLRRSSGEERGASRSGSTGQLPTFSAGYITGEIRQILITTAAMVALLVVLTIVLR